jgi:hypothetical protein
MIAQLKQLFGLTPRPHERAALTPKANIGAYSAQQLPQDPSSVLQAQLLPSLTGPVGLREAGWYRGRFYQGAALPPLRFPLAGASHVNQSYQLEDGIKKVN